MRKYDELLKWFEKLFQQPTISITEAQQSLQKVAAFQQFLETQQEFLRIFERSRFYKRTLNKFDEISKMIVGTHALYSIDLGYVTSDSSIGLSYDNRSHYHDQYEGILLESKQLL